MNLSKENIVEWLEGVWKENKAKGILAQIRFKDELKRGALSHFSRKYFRGCWILSPKREDFYRTRFCFFIHGKIISCDELENVVEPEEILGEAEGFKFKMIAGFLINAGFSVIYSLYTENGEWILLSYNADNEVFKKIDGDLFFKKWRSKGKGRPSRGKKWSEQLKREFIKLDRETLLELYLNEKFYTSYLKEKLRIPVSDPYDVDGFIVSPQSGTIIPFEIKEKFPAEERGMKFFGIDAGRILMLLRLCLPNDSNAFYIIREVDNTPKRNFRAWKFIPLSEIIMVASWNLQRGGKGMGGQETQTIRLPYALFKKLSADTLSDRYLKNIGKLPANVKEIARQFKIFITEEFFNS